MNKLIRFLKFSLPALLLTLVGLEIVFRTIIPAATHPFYRNYEENGMTIGRYGTENDTTGIKTFGPLGMNKARWHINNHGWNSDVDYSFSRADTTIPRIAVIGDSYVEALNVDPEENFAALLRRDLEPAEVFSLGIGGSPLSQYLHFARYAGMMYQPDVYVILIIENDFDESLVLFGDFRNLLLYIDGEGTVEEVTPRFYEIPDPKWRRIGKNSALVRYLYYNLQLTRLARLVRIKPQQEEEKKVREPGVVQPRKVEVSGKKLSDLVRYVLTELDTTAQDKPVVLLTDADRKNLYKNKPPDPSYVATVDTIKQVAEELDMHLIDLQAVFGQAFEANGRRMNNRVDYHWNTYGHKLVADTLAGYLRAKGLLRQSP